MVLWQHVVLCKSTLLRMRLTMGVRRVLRCERHGYTERVIISTVSSTLCYINWRMTRLVYIYIYIYIYMCVCVCVCRTLRENWKYYRNLCLQNLKGKVGVPGCTTPFPVHRFLLPHTCSLYQCCFTLYLWSVYILMYRSCTYTPLLHTYLNVSLCNQFFIDERRYLYAVLPYQISHRYF